MTKRKGIRWKYIQAVNCHECYINNEIAFSIQGKLCVTDLRASRASKEYISPDHYRISSIEEAKQIVWDLIDNKNLEIHHANRDKWNQEQQKTANLMQEVDALLKGIKEGKDITELLKKQ
jgi:hypothetical protein